MMRTEESQSYGLTDHNFHAELKDGIQPGIASLSSSTTSASSSSMSTLTPSTRVRHIYKKARYFFINRQFPDAYTTVFPLITKSTLRDSMDDYMRNHIWKLYLALLDGIMRLPSERLKDGFSKSEISQFDKLVRECAIWDQITEAFELSSTLTADMVLTLTLLCTRHTPTPDVVRVKLENYIQQNPVVQGTPAYSRVVEFYAMVILPACEKWDDARKFVLSNNQFSADKKRDMVSSLQRLKEKSSEARAEREFKEQQRRARRRRQQQKENNPADVNKPGPRFRSLSVTSSKSENDRAERRVPTDSCNALSTQEELVSQIARLWGFLARSCRRPDVLGRLLEILFTIVVVTLALAVPENRARWARIVADLWTRLKKTITMGVRVSYL
ncbi:hypothetical protein V1517DRAFT_319260 [Lipomyces orientalis]|uniref:Uncharacterized protein n=1 Tax=Lipomyces orientalis TaxID=1233043 RepID=A0ACC3TRB5_9ASCO